MFVTRDRGGLLVAEQAADERSVTAALKRLRPDLSLQVRARDEGKGGLLVYKVVHIPTGRVVFTWTDEQGRPLPLSHGLVDEFRRHLLGERGNDSLLDEDEQNRRLLEQLDRQERNAVEAIRDEWRPRLGRDRPHPFSEGRTTVSLGPMRKRRYWQRSHKPGGDR